MHVGQIGVDPRSIPAWAGEPPRAPPRRRRCTVYPRVGGGTIAWVGSVNRGEGLSPRGRGNPRADVLLKGSAGSIPAWAGEPRRCNPSALPCGVYPRVGGGTRCDRSDPDWRQGLSPRGRGNRLASDIDPSAMGSIPAWAGEPMASVFDRTPQAVYPRVGGGTTAGCGWCMKEEGLSPRGRGNQYERIPGRSGDGSIPAWAGEPGWCSANRSNRRVYPRVGGGTTT